MLKKEIKAQANSPSYMGRLLVLVFYSFSVWDEDVFDASCLLLCYARVATIFEGEAMLSSHAKSRGYARLWPELHNSLKIIPLESAKSP